MRRCLFVVVTLSSITTIASAQSPVPVPVPQQGGAALTFISGATTIVSRTKPNDIVARMLSFDANHDGRIAPSELPERMQPLVLQGDANLDGALEVTEIRTLAARPTTANTVRGFPGHPGGYGFGDEGGIGAVSSRSHIEGAIEDLRLGDATRVQATAVAMRFMDTLEADARTTLLKEMEDLLTPEQLSVFKAALDQPQQRGMTRIIIKPRDGGVIKVGTMLDARMEQFALPETKQREGLAAVERYRNKIRPGETERVALVAQMNGILNDEQRDNFSAALARRPLVKAGGPMNIAFDGVVGGVVGGNVVPRGDVTIVRPAILKTIITAPPGVEER